MNKDISQLLQASIPFLSYLVSASPALAQITPDGTVPTQVNQSGNVTEITGGAEKGNNLFHSFKEFSVPTGNEAFFNNATNIENIFSRVTGGSLSNIDGLIRARGSANLFLINPAGILFGRDARLDIGGSFYGSTADSLLFDEGIEFSAVNPQNPILTINAPIGLRFRDNPKPITYRSFPLNEIGRAIPAVKSNQTFALVGGDISLKIESEGNLSLLTVEPDARIELGGLSAAGTVEINKDGSLSFPDRVTRADVSLTDRTAVFINDVGERGGININARNLELSGQSQISVNQLTASGAQDRAIISINASDKVSLINRAVITGRLIEEAVDKVRVIDINTSSLEIFSNLTIEEVNKINETAGALVNNASNISAFANTASSPENEINILNINASDKVLIDKGFITGEAVTGGGQRANMNITTNSLELTNQAQISLTNVVPLDAVADIGKLNINANNVLVDNSRLVAGLGSTAKVGTESNVEITANSVEVVNGGEISSESPGLGDAGSVIINTDKLTVEDNSQISVSSEGGGKAGELIIKANSVDLNQGTLTASTEAESGGDIILDVDDRITLSNNSQITAEATGDANGGRVDIKTEQLTVQSDSIINASARGQGSGGILDIEADFLNLNRGTIEAEAVTGAGGNLTLDIDNNITLSDSSFISARSTGNANGGSIDLKTSNLIVNDSEITASATGEGSGGILDIKADSLNLNGGKISAETTAGTGGDIILDVDDRITLSNNSQITAEATGDANGGRVDIKTEQLTVQSDSVINASARGQGSGGILDIEADFLNLNRGTIGAEAVTGNGGNLTLDIDNNITLSDSSFISARSTGNANGGLIDLKTGNLIINNSEITASATGEGSGGNLKIEVDSLNLNGGKISAETSAGTGGNITLDVDDNIILGNNSQITAQATGDADGGNINIETDFIIAPPNQNSDILASAGQQGTGGRIEINAEGIFGIEVRPQNNTTNDINASGGVDGEIIINTPDVDISKGAIQTPQNVLVLEQIVAQACSLDGIARGNSTLIVNGKGGIPPKLIAPIHSDAIYIDGETVNTQVEIAKKNLHADINNKKQNKAQDIVTLVENNQPVTIDDIIPAQGAIILENGDVVLTAYPTAHSGDRFSDARKNCAT